MPEQKPEVRARNFEEVPTGQSPETAIRKPKDAWNAKNPHASKAVPWR